MEDRRDEMREIRAMRGKMEDEREERGECTNET